MREVQSVKHKQLYHWCFLSLLRSHSTPLIRQLWSMKRSHLIIMWFLHLQALASTTAGPLLQMTSHNPIKLGNVGRKTAHGVRGLGRKPFCLSLTISEWTLRRITPLHHYQEPEQGSMDSLRSCWLCHSRNRDSSHQAAFSDLLLANFGESVRTLVSASAMARSPIFLILMLGFNFSRSSWSWLHA